MTLTETGLRDGLEARRPFWRVCCYLIACTFLGFFCGSLIGLWPGLVAFRSEPGRVILWVRFDQFLAIMSLSCGLTTLMLFRWAVREALASTLIVAALVGGSPWLFIGMVTDGGDWFRLGGAFAGLCAAVAISCIFASLRRHVRRGAVRDSGEL